ncbi:MAG: fluoride efflux transporter CrcB [Phycisphaerae bacterium]
MTKLILIFVGSGLGGVLRYALGGWAHRLTNGSFPFGTLLVNVLGCLLIGFLTAALAGRFLIREELRVAVLIGLLGGFTTFSTFGFETFELMNLGQFGLAGMNVLLSLFGGLSGVWIGYRVAESWLGV